MHEIYVTGSRGLVGSKFVDYHSHKEELITPEIDELDITNYEALNNFFAGQRLSAIVNFAALTDVDGAEKEKDNKNGLFWKVNVEGAVNLAKLAREKKSQLVHISTDFVFGGKSGPYNEITKPPSNQASLSWYGWTKRIAEKEIQAVLSPAIIRISFPFGNPASPKDYLNKIKSAVGKDYPLFEDQKITPTYLPDLFLVIEKILEKKMTGVFHAATSPVTTPYEIGCRLFPETAIKKGSIMEFLKREGIAPRPVIGGFKCEETEKRLGIKFHSWQEALDAWL